MAFSMAREELDAFLGRSLLAHLVTIRRDGTPHITPMWYLWEGGRFIMVTREDRLKFRHISRDPRVAVCVDSSERPYKAVIAQGRAELTKEELELYMKKVIERYESPPASDETLKRWLQEPRVLIRITPERIISWDYSKR